MAPEAIAALVTSGCAVLLGAWNAVRVTRIERLKSALAREETATKAKLDYEYDAKRRLYGQFEPRLFQLLVEADYALERIKSLTDPRTWERLTPAEAEPPRDAGRPMLAEANYVVISTVYGLFAPLVIIRLLGRELTLVDLSLEPRIRLQYHLASRIYGSFKDDLDLAQIPPVLEYDPFHEDWRRLRQQWPAVYWWQGLTMGRLEGVLDLMTVTAEPEQPQRLMTFGEFEQRYAAIVAGDDKRAGKTLAVASNALLNFRPHDRPVLWRMLIAQARLYQALLRTKGGQPQVPASDSEWQQLLSLAEPRDFQWRGDANATPRLSETLDVTDTYLRRTVVDTYPKQAARG